MVVKYPWKNRPSVLLLREIKNNPCVDCKKWYPYYIMEFDHLFNKKFQIGYFANSGGSIKKLWNEIRKCQLVCANCHRIRTVERKQLRAKKVLMATQKSRSY